MPTIDQHEGLDFRHPRGGQALYLQEPLMTNHRRYLDDIARTVLEDGPDPAMIRSVEDLAEEGGVATHAPIEFADLRASGHPSVTSDGHEVYNREPRQHRLTEAELAAKGEAREALEQLTDGAWKAGAGHGSIRPGPLNVIHKGRA